MDENREVCGEFRAPPAARSYETRTEKNRSDASVFRWFAAKSIDILVLTRSHALDPKNRIAITNDVISRATAPNKIVGKVILMRAVAAQRELDVRFEEEVLVTQRVLLAKQAVIRSRAKG